jgi:hypothetical protein
LNNSGQAETGGLKKGYHVGSVLGWAHSKETLERAAVVNNASKKQTLRGEQAGLNNHG